MYVKRNSIFITLLLSICVLNINFQFVLADTITDVLKSKIEEREAQIKILEEEIKQYNQEANRGVLSKTPLKLWT